MFGSGRKAAAQKKAAEEATAKFLAEKFLKEAEEAAAEAEKEVLLALRSAAAAQSAGESAKRAEAHALTAENAAERAISAASVTELAYNKIIAQPETKSPEGDGTSGDTVSLDSEQIVKLHALKEPEGRESPPSGETTQPLNPFDEPDAPVRVVLTSVVPHEEPNTEDQIEILQPRESGSDSNPELVQRELEIEKLRQDVTLLKQEEEARRIEQAQEAARAQAEAEAQARAEAEARAHEQARVAEQARAEQARAEELRKQEEPVAKQSRSGRKPPPPPPKPGGGVTSPPPKPPAELSSTPMTPVSNPMPNLSVLSPVTQPSMEPINEEPTVPAAVSAPPPPPQVKHEEPERVPEPASHAPAPVEEQPTHLPQSTEALTPPAIVEVENNVHTEHAPFADATPAAAQEPVSAPAEPAVTQEAEESQTIGNEHVATSPMTPTTSNGSPSELAEEITAPINNNNNDHAESNTPAVEETKPAEAEVATTSSTTTDSSSHNEAVPEHKSNPLEGFEVLGVVGKGRFAKVVLARRLSDDAQFAIKIMDKSFLIQQNQVANTMSERRVLEQLRHPFLMKLCFAFESANKLYLGLDFVEGGELFYHGQQQPKRRFVEEAVRLWAAELTLGLGHLHMVKHIVFRDLKPENVLLDLEGHIRLTDFGLAKELGDAGGRTQTFCGAKEYLAPEVIQGVPYGFAVDWWTLGILIYELAVGLPPFFSRNTTEMYAKILHADLRFPPFLSPECVHLVRALLERDPSQRLGSKRDFEELQSHPFFAQGKSGSDLQQYWNDVYNRNTSPIYRPNPNNNSLLQQEAIEDNDATTNDTDRTFAGFDYQP